MVNYLNLFAKRIIDDLKQKELVPVKILFFVHMSTILVLYPYLTIHMRQLGINIEETAIMSAVTPVIGVLMPPLAGLLADKIGNFKVLLALFAVFSGLSALLLLVVPIGRITVTYPSEVLLGLGCTLNSPLSVTVSPDYPCFPSDVNTTFLDTNIQLQGCGYACQAILPDRDIRALLQSDRYDVAMHDLSTNTSKTYRYKIDHKDIQLPKDIHKILNHEILTMNTKFMGTIRRYAKNAFFFPMPGVFNLTCGLRDRQSKKIECAFGARDQLIQIQEPLHSPFAVRLNRTSNNTDDVVLYEFSSAREFNATNDNSTKSQPICSSAFVRDQEHIAVTIPLYTTKYRNETYNEIDLGSCAPRCIATAPRKDVCKNDKIVRDVNVQLTFWSYLAVRVFIGVIGGTSYTMFEGAVIAILREYKADYGLQRMYASIGGMISSPISGLLIDVASNGKAYTDFRPIFYLYAGLKIISGFLMLFINLEFKTASKSVVADVKSVMNLELITVFVASFLLGSAWGYIENYLFWFLEDLGGTKSLMGLTITVGGVLGLPILALSGPIINMIGHANVIFIGFLVYAIRLFGYSIIYNPWHALFFEALECLTHSLCFTAMVTYAASLSSMTTDTTIQGILGGLFYGVGKSTGSLVGGFLIGVLGMRGTYQLFSVVTASTAFVYLAFYHFYMKKRSVVTPEDTVPEENAVEQKNGMDMAAVKTTVDAVQGEDNPSFDNIEQTTQSKQPH